MHGANIHERRDPLLRSIDRLADILASRGDGTSASLARANAQRLTEQRFNIVVVGAFKRGKTTLVNAMLGAELLPAAVVPLTSVITCVTTGPDVAAEVDFSDGRRERVGVSDLKRYVTEPGNPANELGVRRATVTVPPGTLADCVFLIDTPGIGSIHRHNTDVARASLAEADGAVLVTAADPPVSEVELAFLREVRDQTARLFVVMNKTDYLSTEDRDATLAFTERAVADAIGREVDVYPVSARRALDARIEGDDLALQGSGIVRFEHDLDRFLATERTDALLISAAGHASRLVDQTLVSVAVEERGLELSSEERTRSIEALERIFVDAARARDDLDALLTREAVRIMSAIEHDLADFQRATAVALLERVDVSLAERRSLRTAAAEVQEEIRSALRDELDRWRALEDGRVDGLLRDATARFGEESDRLVARTIELSGESLGVALDAPLGAAELPAATRFSYDFFRVPTIVESLVPDVRGYLPDRLARRKLTHDFHATIGPLVDKHCGRLRYDYSQRVDEARANLQRDLQERLRTTEGALRDAVERSSSASSADEDHGRRRREALADVKARLLVERENIRRSLTREVAS